jgi:hypothetical protein
MYLCASRFRLTMSLMGYEYHLIAGGLFQTPLETCRDTASQPQHSTAATMHNRSWVVIAK